jgi:2-isopropylmalate synthase
MLREFDSLAARLDSNARRALVDRVKEAEYRGYDLEAANGTFELFMRQALSPGVQFFDVRDYELTIRAGEATARVKIGLRDGDHTQMSATGHGPVHALDVCLRNCLSELPGIAAVRLTDYKVRVLDSGRGTAAKVRVLVEWSDNEKSWSTVGVSEDVIEASWNALVDALRLELMRLAESSDKSVEAYCWNV